MSTEVVKNGSGGRALSADLVAGLVAGIAESRATTPIIGGKPILRLSKAGKWIFGQTDDPVQEGSNWAVNPLAIQHGYVCWSDYPGTQKNELLGSAMVPISEHKPVMPDPIKGFPFKEQRILELRCINGEDEGVEVIYKGSSIGAMKACDNFFAQLQHRLKNVDPTHPVAVIELLAKSYNHAKYGETFNPVFEIVDWATMDGEMSDDTPSSEAASEVEAAPEPETAPEPTKPVLNTKPPLAAKPTVPAEQPARPGVPPRRQRPVSNA